ncbi:MAG TPA: rhomboid family intramembrane serine protease [Puia sp.]|jgi:membrane associated rhomboid family serine protease|nr:rhomboid family intramembrane serine protease [Puia sp.]
MTSFTVVIIAVTSLISFLAFNNHKLMDTLIFWPPAVHMRHQYYRFITCGLIHADFIHLLFNMFTLYFFGKALETYYMGELGLKHYYFLILYISALIAANIPTYLKRKDDYNYRSLGASGAVCAVLFATILIHPWDRLYLYGGIPMPAILYTILFLIYSVYMSKRGGDNVNHDAHLWGALYGILFTVAVSPGVVPTFINELRNPRF